MNPEPDVCHTAANRASVFVRQMWRRMKRRLSVGAFAIVAGLTLWGVFRMYRYPEFIAGVANMIFVCQ